MDRFLEIDREVFTQFCTDGKIFYLSAMFLGLQEGE